MSKASKVCAVCQQTSQSLKVCGGCALVAYCSKDHQRDDWKKHKLVCKPQEKKPAAAAAPPPSSASSPAPITTAAAADLTPPKKEVSPSKKKKSAKGSAALASPSHTASGTQAAVAAAAGGAAGGATSPSSAPSGQRPSGKDTALSFSSSSSSTKGPKKSKVQMSDDVPVLWEDQNNINHFGRLNTRLQDLRDLIKAKEREVENFKDAVSELEALIDDDEDTCKMKVGEVLVFASVEDTTAYAQKKLQEAQQELVEHQKEKGTISEEMTSLKALLYAKFGNTINLENKEDE